ncbi:MAG: hypothetical protein IJC09_07570 [Clostridia bacterium]|nr:hypothetical protein [Clostridia bacterium]
MIYSDDINKVCGLCVYAQKLEDSEDEMFCTLFKKNTATSQGDCKKFKYDIFKKTVRRKRRLKTEFTAEDFEI